MENNNDWTEQDQIRWWKRLTFMLFVLVIAMRFV